MRANCTAGVATGLRRCEVSVDRRDALRTSATPTLAKDGNEKQRKKNVKMDRSPEKKEVTCTALCWLQAGAYIMCMVARHGQRTGEQVYVEIRVAERQQE